MHIRVSTKRRGGKSYKYAQLVESYRRDDGVPAHRVLASLGHLSEAEIENLRVALRASREGRTLVLEESAEAQEWQARVVANLRYLDVAVAMEVWRRWELPGLFNRLLPRRLDAVAPGAIIAALVVQRCTDPGSKLYAQRWFPRTALPELTGISAEQFNNTRIHRVLEHLDRIDGALQADLPTRYERKDGAFATIFMDVTDAWFAGEGPELAERDRTKEGFRNRRKVGVVLVCNQDGYPLRWAVTPGRRRDPQCMAEMLDCIQGESWIGDAPLICDRAMGAAKSVAKLFESGARFLTATLRTEINSYTDSVPYGPFLDLSPVGSELTREGEIEVAANTALSAGLHKIDDRLYFFDLGVQERKLAFQRPDYDYSGARWNPDDLEGGAAFLALARIYRARIAQKEFPTMTALAKSEGVTRSRVSQIMKTLRLAENLQERILRGEFGYIPERLLRTCVRFRREPEQRRLLEEHAKTVRAPRRSASSRPFRRVGRHTVRVRLVAYFNPEMFVNQRAVLSRRRQRVEDAVADLNRRLCSPKSHRERESIKVEVRNLLARSQFLKVYEFRVNSVREKDTGRKYWRVHLRFDAEEWQRRIRYAGFVLLVGHPDLPHSGEHLVELFRQKDTVEKDFQTIKDVVKLRPFYHHTDPKVRAHVTLCMLALLVERTIERRLKKSGLKSRSRMPKTAAACFEELRTCHLNILGAHPALASVYAATEPTQEQRAILRSLRMKSLVEAEEIASCIKPRAKS